MSSAPAVLNGSAPRILVAPPSTASDLGDDAIDLAASVGLHLDDWQQQVLRVGLAEDGERWAAFEVAVVVARQNGKDSIFEALQLAKLFLAGDELIIHSAHEFKTAREAFRRVWSLIEGDSELRARTLKRVLNPSEQGIDLRSGQRLRFFARTSGSGRGWTADTLILNEAFRLGGEQMAALLPTLSSRPNPQVWYGSSAALSDSEQLHSVRKRALSGETDRLAYLEWSAPEDCDPADPHAWIMANPSPRVPQEFIAAEYGAMPLPQFRRERLSIPDEPLGVGVFPLDVWNACSDPSAAPRDPVVFAVDVDPNRSHSSIAACGVSASGVPVVEIIDDRAGVDWVVPRLTQLNGDRPAAIVVDQGSPAGALIAQMAELRLPVQACGARDVTQACGQFFDAVFAADVIHRNEQSLNRAVVNVRKRSVGEAWAWARKDAATDITPLYAATLALWGHRTYGRRGAPRILAI